MEGYKGFPFFWKLNHTTTRRYGSTTANIILKVWFTIWKDIMLANLNLTEGWDISGFYTKIILR